MEKTPSSKGAPWCYTVCSVVPWAQETLPMEDQGRVRQQTQPCLSIRIASQEGNAQHDHYEVCLKNICIFQFSSVAQSCPTLSDLMDCIMPASLSITNSRNLLKLMCIKSVMPSNHLILCHPLLLLPSIFPSIRVFSNESVLCIRWPKYWSFSFSISSSNEYSGLISFRMEWLYL